MPPLSIANHPIGRGHPCFVIAEAGVNHNGDRRRALDMIDAAAAAGADAVKFQTYEAAGVMTRDAPKADYQVQATGDDQSQFDMVHDLELDADDHHALVQRAHERDLILLSTPFTLAAIDFLAELGLPAIKVPSGEINHIEYLTRIGALGRPVIVSTGMSTLAEVDVAVQTLRAAGAHELALLHCVSNYPADPADANLHAMATLRREFDLPVGFSDHTTGIDIAPAAVALGACIVEKHFTLDQSLPGPDHQASIEPQQLAALVRSIRRVEAALGDGAKRPAASEANTAAVARRSLVAARDLPAGTTLAADMLVAKRPGTGIPPDRVADLLGKTLLEATPADALLTWEMLG